MLHRNSLNARVAGRRRKTHARGDDNVRVQRGEKGCTHGLHHPEIRENKPLALLSQSQRSKSQPSSLRPRGSGPSPPPSDPGVQAQTSSFRIRSPGSALLPQTQGFRPSPPSSSSDPGVQAQPPLSDPGRVLAQTLLPTGLSAGGYLSGRAQFRGGRAGRSWGSPWQPAVLRCDTEDSSCHSDLLSGWFSLLIPRHPGYQPGQDSRFLHPALPPSFTWAASF